jgi:hypothetical protein
VKIRRYILSLSAVIVSVFFLAASTGITVIVHDCPVCHDFYVRSGILIEPAEPADDCCEAAERHCSTENSITVEGTCCHFDISHLRLINYTPSVNNNTPALVAVITDNQNIHIIKSPELPVLIPEEFHNKHGGRYITTYNHQLIS